MARMRLVVLAHPVSLTVYNALLLIPTTSVSSRASIRGSVACRRAHDSPSSREVSRAYSCWQLLILCSSKYRASTALSLLSFNEPHN